MIVKIPLEYFPAFYEEPERATLELLSIPSGSINPFFRNHEKIAQAFERGENRSNPLDELTYQFSPSFVAEETRPRYMHIDLAINGDYVGIAMCHAYDFETRTMRMPGDLEAREVSMPKMRFDFVGRLAPRLEFGEIAMNYNAIEAMIDELAHTRGFNLHEGLITFDRFQSHQLMQSIRGMNIPCGLLSIDHTTSKVLIDYKKDGLVRKEGIPREPAAAMVSLRDAFYREALDIPEITPFDDHRNWLEKELDECQWDGTKQKALKMEGGTDDMLQAVAGAVFNCNNNADPEMEVPLLDQDDQMSEESYYNAIGREDVTGFDLDLNADGYVEDGTSLYDERHVGYLQTI